MPISNRGRPSSSRSSTGMPELTPNQTGDLSWLDGYRMRANGKPKPTAPATAADGWADLDALMQLIQAGAKDREKMAAEIEALRVKDEALGARVLKLEQKPDVSGGYG